MTPLEPVDNAIFYRDDYNAESCMLGYGVSSNRKECIKIDKKYEGCIRGSFDTDGNLMCSLCDNGHEIDPKTNSCTGV